VEVCAVADIDAISRPEFQNFRGDVARYFETLHGCDGRIEKKIDDLAGRLEPVIDEYAHRQERTRRRWDVKMAAFAGVVGVAASLTTAGLLWFLGL
jgi:hypothetical protein